jgi:hypothetical protein
VRELVTSQVRTSEDSTGRTIAMKEAELEEVTWKVFEKRNDYNYRFSPT